MQAVTRRQLLLSLPACGLSATLAHSALGQLVTGLSRATPQPGQLESKLDFASSSTKLVDVFHWARTQAMAYAFDRGDPVGPWCEAVEPGREGFCVRDTCHQALGAHALGLAKFSINMLRRFAQAVSDSKDWCSYWEINRFNEPCPVDYEDDAAFWYNLPANFDLVDCCYRMFVWSGDPAYIHDPALLNLYDRTVNDYVERWDLDLSHIMTRPRLLNVRGILDPGNRFQKARGIPGYNEGDHTYVLGFDVVVTQHAAYLAYANLQGARGNAELSAAFQRKAAGVEDLIKKRWWNKDGQCFYARLSADYKLEGSSGHRSSPYLSPDWHCDVGSNAGGFSIAEDADAEMARLLDLSHARLEYPEVSFTRVGDLVTTAMGINPKYRSPVLSVTDGGWVEVELQTFSGLGTQIEWAEVRNLPVRDCTVTMRHDGPRRTTLTNQLGPALIWTPMFAGAHATLLVNGQQEKAHTETDYQGRTLSTVRVTAGAGGTITVEVPGSSTNEMKGR
jgi:hypothetical protein